MDYELFADMQANATDVLAAAHWVGTLFASGYVMIDFLLEA